MSRKKPIVEDFEVVDNFIIIAFVFNESDTECIDKSIELSELEEWMEEQGYIGRYTKTISGDDGEPMELSHNVRNFYEYCLGVSIDEEIYSMLSEFLSKKL